jgi:hypothetical protein
LSDEREVAKGQRTLEVRVRGSLDRHTNTCPGVMSRWGSSSGFVAPYVIPLFRHSIGHSSPDSSVAHLVRGWTEQPKSP